MPLFYWKHKRAVVLQPALVFFCALLAPACAHIQENYDFVIVGGGTAGCVLASRLSENGKHSVLLLEAGGEPHPNLDIPATYDDYRPMYMRNYQSVPQSNAGLLNGGTIQFGVGRLLGGGSSVNRMVWNRGSPYDFDNWARISNDSSWSYSNLLQFFKKSENYMGRFPSDQQHGHGGPVTISQPSYAPLLQEWLEAGRHLGYPNGDPNGPQRIGYTTEEFTKRFGRRVSSYTGYLKPVMGRRNLRVVTEAEATQILFEGKKKAIGVRYRVNQSSGRPNTTRLVFARNEVIVSAGAIESPTLLMRSGIGPKHVLEAANIQQIQELPVGLNLQDHLVVITQFIINNGSAVYNRTRDLNPGAMELFNKVGDGPYSIGGSIAQATLNSGICPNNGNNSLWADINIHFISSAGVSRVPGLSGPLAEWETPILTWNTLARPSSRGKLELNPEDPYGPPIIDFQYLTDNNGQDMQVMVEAIKTALKTFERTPPFRRLGARYPPVALGPCRNVKFRSDAYWKCFVKQLAMSGFHPCGTARMGRGAEDRDAVVDSKLKVIGLDGLRVVDASIMPTIPTTNLQAPVYAIAEKAAQMILQSWT